MKPARIFFYILATLVILITTSCSNKGEFNQRSEGEDNPVVIVTKTITDYTATDVKLQLVGTVLDTLSELDRLQFYLDSSCKGTKLGEALVSQFKTSGAPLSIPIGSAIKLYVSTEASNDCVFLENYDPGVLSPHVPIFSETIPTSPSRTSTSPGIFGTAFPSSGTIRFYNDVSCTSLIGQDTSTKYNSVGISLTATENDITTVYAVVEDLRGGISPCTHLTDYIHSNQLSGPPQLISMSHISPNKNSFTPTVKGSTAVGSVSVELFSDPGCLVSLASGTPNDFLVVGFQVTAVENGTMAIYAKSIDDVAQPSVCALLTSYTHDDVDPGNPAYVSVSPVSPTNQTTQPKVRGTSTADTESISFYDSNTCLTLIGSGTKVEFEALGSSAGVKTDDITNIYAKAFDAAGNGSLCVFFTSYTHNTIPPSPPLFEGTVPLSPTNGTLTPLVRGTVSARTVAVNLYSDALCSSLVGSGTDADYNGAGIQVNVLANTTNALYVTVSDFEGNVSDCAFHAVYDHSNAAAPNPGFFATFPTSPSKSSFTPTIIGSADASIEAVSLYGDAICTNLLGTGTKGQFTSAGITVNLPLNSTNDIYAVARDVFGNDSACVLLTQYIHNTVAPLDPTYLATAPISPNNNSITPTLTGTALDNPLSQLPANRVAFFDSPSCISKLGEGVPADFAGAGIQINVPSNTLTFLYAKSFDAASNGSACVFMANYTHNNLKPGIPFFLTASPQSPSYTEDITIAGGFLVSPDFMNRVSVVFYSDIACTMQIGSESPANFEAAGVPLTVLNNATTSIYAVSINEVSTKSDCTLLTSFTHYDLAPTSLTALSNIDGSVGLNWNPDLSSNPVPTYSVERSVSTGGPFSVIATGLNSNNLKDILISDNTSYFYRVFASNNTGRSLYSVEANITTAAPAAIAAASLSALEEDSKVTLSWSGFPQNMVYKVLRSTNSGGPFTDLGVTLTTTIYGDVGLTNGQEYYYIVVASNPSGETVQSNMASAVPKIAPLAPTEFDFKPIASLASCVGAQGGVASWTAPSYYNDFSLYRGITKGSLLELVRTSSIKSERCGIVSGEVYYYRVGANWGANSSPYSGIVGFYARSAPSFTVYPGDGEVRISWVQPSLHVDLTGLPVRYDLFSSTDYKGDYTLLAGALAGLSYNDPVANGTGKFYYLQAYVTDLDGDKVYIGYPTQTVGVSPDLDPGLPTNLTLSVENGVPRLNWTKPDHYNQFKVYHSMNFGGPYSVVLTVNSPLVSTAPVFVGMNYFKVTSTWGAFESADSNIVSYREAELTGLSLATGAVNLDLSWDAIAGIQDYEVFRSTDLNGVYVSIGTPLVNSYTDATAVSGVGYYYKVKARFADATEGKLSDGVSGMRTDSSTPSNVSLTVIATSFLKADWPVVSGATQYKVFIATSLAGPYTDRGFTFSNTKNLTGLAANTEYFVKVTSFVGAAQFQSAAASKRTYATPTAPQGTPGNNEVNLSWSAVGGAIDYNILRSTDGVTFAPIAASFVGTSYLDATAVNGNIYFYKIQVNYAIGQTESGQSFGISPGITPLVPKNLRAENNTTGVEVEVSWAAVSGTTSYNVYVSTVSGVYGVAARSSSGSTDVRLTGLLTGTTYYITVTALNGNLESAMSNEVAIIPQLEAAAPLAKYSDAATVNITWGAIPGASTYDLLRSLDGVDFDIVTTGLVAANHLDATVNPAKTYYYRYKGYSATGAEMSLSQVSSGVNLSQTPQVPLGFYLSSDLTTAVNLFWTHVPSVGGYEVLRSLASGGPYVTVGSPLPADTTYLDNTVIPGTKYFYVIRSLSLSGTPSPNSVEKSVELVAGPTGLAAVNGATTIDLSWNPVAGAVTYNILRSFVSGGPYGLISNVAPTSYSDADIIADKTYYYVVEAVLADGSITLSSAEVSILRAGYISLQVAVELTDGPMSSSSAGNVDFERTLTSFDTNGYDGVTSYELEVVATNQDVVVRKIAMVDDANTEIGFVNIPAATATPTRIKAVVIPNAGLDVYRVRLEQTGSNGDLTVYSAKLLVNQTNATKTKLYFPLLTSDQSPTNQDDSAYSYSTNGTVYQDFQEALIYQRIANKLKNIIEYNAWELEAVVSTTGPAEGILGLFNMDSSQIIETTETRFASNTIELASIPFDEGMAEFDSSNEGDHYGIRLKCEISCGAGTVRIYKTGLWVQLENLSGARLVNRVTDYKSFLNIATDFTEMRSFVDMTQFTTPKAFFQITVEDDALSSGDFELIYSAQDSGIAGISPLVGSSMTADNDGLSLMLSPQLIMPAANNFMTRFTPAAGDVNLRDASIVIEVGN